MTRCPRCGTPVRPGARFCGGCGAAAGAAGATSAADSRRGAPGRACDRCGRPLRRDARFCGGCGASATTITATANPATANTATANTATANTATLAPANAAPTPTAPPRTAVSTPARATLWVAPAALAGTLSAALGREIDVLCVRPGDAIATVQAALREAGARLPAAVCLVGDDGAVPFARLPDPTGYDDALLTDVLYGMRDVPDEAARRAGDVLPDVPVTRIPSVDPAVVTRVLAAGARLADSWSGGLAVSAAVWERASGDVLRDVGADPRLHLAPPGSRDDVTAGLATGPGRLYWNVHGTDQDAVWLGEGDGRYPEVLRPEDVPTFPGAPGTAPVVTSEACYGATLADGAGSIAPTFLARGAGAFLGSTVIAWGGPPGAPPALADVLVARVWRALDAGLGLADALQTARSALLEAALDRDGGLPAPLHNTLLSFVAYGAPHAAVAGARAVAPRSPSRPSSRPATPRAAGDGVLATTRESLRARLDPGSWRVVSSGRESVASLARGFREGLALTRRLEALLGALPADARVVRYDLAGTPRALVTAEVPAGPVPRRAALDVDGDGRLLAAWTSR